MPTIIVYHHGISAGVPPGRNDHVRRLRSDVQGWSAKSIRSNTRFLYSVLESQLTGWGFAITLTLRDCPPDHATWVNLRRTYLKRLERRGLLRSHWVTEWQRRGVPHLHGAVWLPEGVTEAERAHLGRWLVEQWIDVARAHQPLTRSQHVAPIKDPVGWFKYLSKHAARGLSHYQRAPEAVPAAWKKTGRMWGYTGDWPRLEGIKFDICRPGWFAFRRIIRRYRIANARSAKDRRRLHQARHMLTDNQRGRSEVRGISEWIELDMQLQVVAFLGSVGFEVSQIE